MKNIQNIGLPNYVTVNIILVRINFTAENKNVKGVFLKMGWVSSVGHGRKNNRTAK